MRGAMKSLAAAAFSTMGITALATSAPNVAAGRAHVSKHRQRDQDGKWIPGKVRISERSGLRKLMRAARRGMMPPERQVVIDTAMQNAARPRRALTHMSASARERVRDVALASAAS